MKRGIGAHRVTDHMGLFDAERVHDRDHIASRNILPVARRIVRHVRRRIAALAVGDAAMRARKTAHLRLPGTIVAGEFVDEDNRRAAAGFFVIEAHAVGSIDLGHRPPRCRGGAAAPACYAPCYRTNAAGATSRHGRVDDIVAALEARGCEARASRRSKGATMRAKIAVHTPAIAAAFFSAMLWSNSGVAAGALAVGLPPDVVKGGFTYGYSTNYSDVNQAEAHALDLMPDDEGRHERREFAVAVQSDPGLHQSMRRRLDGSASRDAGRRLVDRQ